MTANGRNKEEMASSHLELGNKDEMASSHLVLGNKEEIASSHLELGNKDEIASTHLELGNKDEIASSHLVLGNHEEIASSHLVLGNNEEIASSHLVLGNRQTTSVPFSDYCLVGWALDITGRRLLDEICHIAAYVPNADYSRYIMPHGDLNEAAKRSHRMYIKSSRFGRSLIDRTRNKVLQTTGNHRAAIAEFLKWLEDTCHREQKSGVLLIFHEKDKFVPSVLLKTIEELNLTKEFLKLVKGFVNSNEFSKEKFSDVFKSHDLEILSMVLLNKTSVDVSKANFRARLAYEIIQHLCAGGSTCVKLGSDSPNGYVIKEILPFATSVEEETSALNNTRNRIAKQNEFKPIFDRLLHFSTPTHKRIYNTKLRTYLVDTGFDYQILANL